MVLIRNEPVYLRHARAGLVWQPRPTKRFEGKQTAPLPHLLCMVVCAILKTIDGAAEKSKISSISTSAAGFYAKSCLCLRNIRHFLCFQIHLSVYYVLRPDVLASGLKFLFAINNKVYSCQRFKKRDK